MTTDFCIEAVQGDFEFYSQERPHTGLDDNTPDGFYYKNLPAALKAAWALTARLPLKK